MASLTRTEIVERVVRQQLLFDCKGNGQNGTKPVVKKLKLLAALTPDFTADAYFRLNK